MNARLAAVLSVSMMSFAAAGTALAGPLDPPSGAVGGSMKTLTEVEPRIAVNAANTPGNAQAHFRIIEPGSYYLTSNITAPEGKSAISIHADNVTLDLNGFQISGGVHGVVSGLNSNIVVRNGSVTGAGSGIYFMGRPRITVENVRITNVQQFGITVGADCRVVACDINGAQTGISTGIRSRVEGCTVSNVTGTGIDGYYYSQVVDCSVATAGTHGIAVAGNAEVRNCFVRQATQSGIRTGSSAIVAGCRVEGQAAVGIEAVGTGTMITGSSVSECQRGIKGGAGNTIEGCTSERNVLTGIEAGPGSIVRNCHSRSNGYQGIVVGSHCVVTGCYASQNGTAGTYAGFWINGSECRVEDNHSARNGHGFWVDGTDNFIVRNTSRGNTVNQFHVPAGNDIAPVIANPANTFTGATPWSNFAF